MKMQSSGMLQYLLNLISIWRMVLGKLLNYQMVKRQLDLNRCTRKSTMQISHWSIIKHMWLQKDLISDQIRTILKPLHLQCDKQLCVLCWPWLQLKIWNYDLWTSHMHSQTVILMLRFTWKSQRDLKPSKVEKDLSIDLISPYMG